MNRYFKDNSKVVVQIVIIFLGVNILMSCSVGKDERTSKKAMMPIYEVEATVISLSPDLNRECEEKCPGYEYPIDRGVIRVDKIISVYNPDNVEGNGYNEGDLIDVSFLYSARPARIIYLPSSASTNQESLPPEIPVSSNASFAEPIPKSGEYFIFSIETSAVNQQKETVLPGLQKDSKINVKVSLESPSKGLVTEYELIN